VCDAFNAMTTHRTYRRAMSVDASIAELRAGSGTQFSPRAAATLIELIETDRAMVGPAGRGEEAVAKPPAAR
jgi:HD-GYP domain-containing protein (c-di-GMP phosphodiesterase class II)